MAPAKSTKRGATQVAPKASAASATQTPPQKKPKIDPMIVAVNEAINNAVLPEACRDMLLAGAPECLLTPADQRHELQEMMVKMIGDLFETNQKMMQEALDADNDKIKEAEATKDGHAATVTAALASLEVLAEDIIAKEKALECASQAVLDAKATVAEAQLAQSRGDAELVKAEKEKKVIDEALSEHVKALKEEGDWETAKAQQHLDVLLPLTKLLALDESLITALPTSCMKKPSDRSGFDVMVTDQLEADLSKRVADLTVTLSNGSPASAERAAAVVAAQTALDQANDDHQRAAAELSVSQTTHREAASSLQSAREASNSFLSEYTGLIEVRDKKVFEMDNYKNYNLLCFTTLRNKTVKKVEQPVDGTAIPDSAPASV